jgi:ABC-type glycerol-3-phosphate transport system substrate-binding protein
VAVPSADAGDVATAAEEGMTFQNGKAAMRFVDSTGASGFYDRIKDFQWDVTLAPLGDKKKSRVQTIIGSGAAIFNESKSPDLAWAFIEFLNDPQYILEQIRAEGALSVYASKKVMESKEYQGSPLPPSDKKLFIKGLEAGKFFPEATWEMRAMGVEPPPTEIGKVFDCSAAPREVLPPGAAAINGALKQAGVGCP